MAIHSVREKAYAPPWDIRNVSKTYQDMMYDMQYEIVHTICQMLFIIIVDACYAYVDVSVHACACFIFLRLLTWLPMVTTTMLLPSGLGAGCINISTHDTYAYGSEYLAASRLSLCPGCPCKEGCNLDLEVGRRGAHGDGELRYSNSSSLLVVQLIVCY
jgi:hypothetical protein